MAGVACLVGTSAVSLVSLGSPCQAEVVSFLATRTEAGPSGEEEVSLQVVSPSCSPSVGRKVASAASNEEA